MPFVFTYLKWNFIGTKRRIKELLCKVPWSAHILHPFQEKQEYFGRNDERGSIIAGNL